MKQKIILAVLSMGVLNVSSLFAEDFNQHLYNEGFKIIKKGHFRANNLIDYISGQYDADSIKKVLLNKDKMLKALKDFRLKLNERLVNEDYFDDGEKKEIEQNVKKLNKIITYIENLNDEKFKSFAYYVWQFFNGRIPAGCF